MYKIIHCVVLFLLLASSSTVFSDGRAPYDRVQNVPRETMWIGGSDGGVFVVLKTENLSGGIYRAKVFADHTGELLYEGKLALTPPTPALPATDDPTLFTAWDGSALLLADGRRMVRRR